MVNHTHAEPGNTFHESRTAQVGIRLQLQLDEGRTRAHSEHIEILERIRKKDKRGAIKLLRQHILVTGEKLISSLSTLSSLREN